MSEKLRGIKITTKRRNATTKPPISQYHPLDIDPELLSAISCNAAISDTDQLSIQ